MFVQEGKSKFLDETSITLHLFPIKDSLLKKYTPTFFCCKTLMQYHYFFTSTRPLQRGKPSKSSKSLQLLNSRPLSSLPRPLLLHAHSHCKHCHIVTPTFHSNPKKISEFTPTGNPRVSLNFFPLVLPFPSPPIFLATSYFLLNVECFTVFTHSFFISFVSNKASKNLFPLEFPKFFANGFEYDFLCFLHKNWHQKKRITKGRISLKKTSESFEVLARILVHRFFFLSNLASVAHGPCGTCPA